MPNAAIVEAKKDAIQACVVLLSTLDEAQYEQHISTIREFMEYLKTKMK
jgi:hypothetical protein